MPDRCGKCPNCLEVERVKTICLRTLARSQMKGLGGNDDVRLLWNTTLEERPCTGTGDPENSNEN